MGQENTSVHSNSRPTTPLTLSKMVSEEPLLHAPSETTKALRRLNDDIKEDNVVTDKGNDGVIGTRDEDDMILTGSMEEQEEEEEEDWDIDDDDEEEGEVEGRSTADRIGMSVNNGRADVREETQEEKEQRELEESEALARQLMAEEALASYSQSADYLRNNSQDFNPEDLAALQAALQEEDPNGGGLEEDSEGEIDLDYDGLLELGERIGDVKEERWKLKADSEIAKLPVIVYKEGMFSVTKNDSEGKCLVCQCGYEDGERLIKLPCEHIFHEECATEWLKRKDVCAYCRVSIIKEEEEEKVGKGN